ncbi:carboxymuconolactone decarboxylase family protein [Legionella bononiensis]|uniref:Alkyl hydroperoxide reductase AhpD n=1 Tax=Legionella bononiensis TaxID=2793102 RepID=A0ABS1WAW8_9GAMM|nr:carboxymuconolactone decarboxylase family protein [Legionella bononiensis]MBL7480266.1 carboxymuconolactone decarboxylase family protein [Legionella bononiensis]MBL7526502.1 carboxymuconolactone decarboxylase family protein [Legionella bononiensis]MBL7563004.1 carboxymuconolactone decarboxylase family protein [Legionella bononiensis]
MIENIKNFLPEIAKDIRLNLGKVLDVSMNDGLSKQQILGSALAVAYSLGDKELITEIKEEIDDEQVINASQLAASLMAMTNIYYRFVHLTENPEVEHIPAGLRMQGMMNPGVDRVTFETLSLAVSSLNGCGTCISSHTHQLKEHGFSAAAIARVGRISAVIHAVYVSKRFR